MAVAPANRTAVVTGGASGIGAACADRLRKEGVRVLTLDRASSADLVVDITDAAAVAAAAAETGPVDVLVNSAGIVGPSLSFLETSLDDWRRVIEVNLFGTVNCMQAFVPDMVERGWGRVVNIASVAGKEGNPSMSVYSASKGATITLTKAVGKELATTGVIVNAVAPGNILTPMSADTPPDVLERYISLIPMARRGQASEVAELVAWLASEKVTFSTGSVYDISGGRATY